MIFVANGMPRSGSLLQYNLARVMLESRENGSTRVVGTQTLRECEDRRKPSIQDAAGSDDWFLVHAHEIRHLAQFFRRFSVITTLELARQGRLMVGHTFRDLRDVAASLRWFYGPTRTDTLGDLGPAVAYHRWLSTYRSEPWVLFQRYEDTVEDLSTAAMALSRLLGVWDESAVSHAVQECSLNSAIARQTSLQERAQAIGLATGDPGEIDGMAAVQTSIRLSAPDQHRFGIRDFRSRMFLHHVSPRRGQSGAWSEVLTEDEIRMIEWKYVAYLVHEGYELTDDARVHANNQDSVGGQSQGSNAALRSAGTR